MKKKKGVNYLDMIPKKNSAFTCDKTANLVTLHMAHTGLFHRLTQKFAHRPAVSYIELDEYGSFLWLQIDGKKSVEQLALALEKRFGARVNPLYKRLIHYLQLLHNNKFIRWIKKY